MLTRHRSDAVPPRLGVEVVNTRYCANARATRLVNELLISSVR